MLSRRLLPMLVLVLLAVPASAGAALPEEAAGAESDAAQSASSAATLRPGKVIRTRRSWECRGRLRAYGRLPIKVISNMPNPGDGDAIRLIGCRGDGDRSTVDLILDVNGNGRGRGTAFDAVRIGMDARDLVVTGDVECGARHTNPNIHQDIVQALSGRNIYFRKFTSGTPEERSMDVLGGRRRVVRHLGERRDPHQPHLQPLSSCDLQPEPADRRVRAFGREELGLRLLARVRHLHRPGGPPAGEQEQPRDRVLGYFRLHGPQIAYVTHGAPFASGWPCWLT